MRSAATDESVFAVSRAMSRAPSGSPAASFASASAMEEDKGTGEGALVEVADAVGAPASLRAFLSLRRPCFVGAIAAGSAVVATVGCDIGVGLGVVTIGIGVGVGFGLGASAV